MDALQDYPLLRYALGLHESPAVVDVALDPGPFRRGDGSIAERT